MLNLVYNNYYKGMLNRVENKNYCFKEVAYIIKNGCSKLKTNTNDEKTKCMYFYNLYNAF